MFAAGARIAEHDERLGPVVPGWEAEFAAGAESIARATAGLDRLAPGPGLGDDGAITRAESADMVLESRSRGELRGAFIDPEGAGPEDPGELCDTKLLYRVDEDGLRGCSKGAGTLQ